MELMNFEIFKEIWKKYSLHIAVIFIILLAAAAYQCFTYLQFSGWLNFLDPSCRYPVSESALYWYQARPFEMSHLDINDNFNGSYEVFMIVYDEVQEEKNTLQELSIFNTTLANKDLGKGNGRYYAKMTVPPFDLNQTLVLKYTDKNGTLHVQSHQLEFLGHFGFPGFCG